jgi:hypothetical protein
LEEDFASNFVWEHEDRVPDGEKVFQDLFALFPQGCHSELERSDAQVKCTNMEA